MEESRRCHTQGLNDVEWFSCFFHASVQLYQTPNIKSSHLYSTKPIILIVLHHILIDVLENSWANFHFHVLWTFNIQDFLFYWMKEIKPNSLSDLYYHLHWTSTVHRWDTLNLTENTQESGISPNNRREFCLARDWIRHGKYHRCHIFTGGTNYDTFQEKAVIFIKSNIEN